MVSGRLVIYTDDVRRDILHRLSEGETLRAICRTVGYPDNSTVIKWVREDPDGYGKRYAQAREIGYQIMADEIIDEARTPRLGAKRKIKGDGSEEIEEGDAVDRARLHIDTLKWFVSKALPKIYGNRPADDGDDDPELVNRPAGL